MRERRGLFIVFEGSDKSGKSTQAKRLVEHLKSQNIACLHTREPGGSNVTEKIRHILLDPNLHVTPMAELLLYEASRAQHTEEVLRPALQKGSIVICERYTMSTDVYQGVARGLGLKVTKTLNRIATSGLKANMTFVFDIPEKAFKTRDLSRSLDRLELESDDFHSRVRAGYRAQAKKDRQAVLIDGLRPLDDISADILKRVLKLIK